MPYAVTKAAQLQLVKCLGATQGPKIRVNTVLPGLLLTEWVCGVFTPFRPSVSRLIFPFPSDSRSGGSIHFAFD
jgi:NAD(P)-dependent dehydrogenase (short-subunit alcohol dehydrogenase family)